MTEQLYFYNVDDNKIVGEMFTSWDDVYVEFRDKRMDSDLVVLSIFDGVVDEVSGYCADADEGEELQRIHADEEDFVNELVGKTLEVLRE